MSTPVEGLDVPRYYIGGGDVFPDIDGVWCRYHEVIAAVATLNARLAAAEVQVTRWQEHAQWAWLDAWNAGMDLNAERTAREALEAALREIDTVARSDEHHARIAAIARVALSPSGNGGT